MADQRVFVSTAFVALTSALIGLAALAAGGSNYYGSLSASERYTYGIAAASDGTGEAGPSRDECDSTTSRALA